MGAAVRTCRRTKKAKKRRKGGRAFGGTDLCETVPPAAAGSLQKSRGGDAKPQFSGRSCTERHHEGKRWAQVLYTLLAQYARTSTGADGNGTDSGSGPSQPTTCARSHVQHHGGDGIPVGLTTFSTPVGKRGKSDRNQGETTGPVEGLIRAGHIKTV